MGSAMLKSVAAVVSLCGLLQSVSAAPSATPLPVVDLGYELQQATLFNSTGQFYNFSNIRYAAPPTGNLRFRAPQPPATNRTTVQKGTPDRICAQANPAWELIAEQFIPEYLEGQTVFNQSSFNISSGGGLPTVDPRTTEDCLFLDVVVPKAIFNNAGKGPGAPVMVWIYGELFNSNRQLRMHRVSPLTCISLKAAAILQARSQTLETQPG